MVKAVGAAVLCVSLVVPMIATAQGAPTDQVTGGGQVVLSGADLEAAGDTIAIEAQETPDGARGNVQYVETSAAGGASFVRWHGSVTCVAVDGNVAQIGGTIREAGATRSGFFAIEVADNGEPRGGADVDVIKLTYPDEAPDCDGDFSEVDELTLARGNVRVHDAA